MVDDPNWQSPGNNGQGKEFPVMRHIGKRFGMSIATTIGKSRVSTVRLGSDHRRSFDPPGPPLLFETAVWSVTFGEKMERYATYEAALAGHKKWVNTVIIDGFLHATEKVLKPAVLIAAGFAAGFSAGAYLAHGGSF